MTSYSTIRVMQNTIEDLERRVRKLEGALRAIWPEFYDFVDVVNKPSSVTEAQGYISEIENIPVARSLYDEE